MARSQEKTNEEKRTAEAKALGAAEKIRTRYARLAAKIFVAWNSKAAQRTEEAPRKDGFTCFVRRAWPKLKLS